LVKETGKKKVYLCAKIGKCPTYLRDSKKQNTNIKGDDLRILAEELNTTPEYLAGESDKKEKPATIPGDELGNTAREIMDMISDFSIEELALVKARIAKIKESR
jgi:hypothetical protein